LKVNIITNIANGAGLQRDYELVSRFLKERGHQTHPIQFNAASPTLCPADINLFLETLEPRFFHLAAEQWIIPNPEWWSPNYSQHLKRQDFRYVLCKTRDAVNLLQNAGAPKEKLKFIGFMSRDLYDQSIQKVLGFLHVAGNSQVKNTRAVIDTWRIYRIQAPLTVVSKFFNLQPTANQRWHRAMSEEMLKMAMNQHTFHILPSAYEGYGHAIHEAMGCAGIVLTTNRAPMNEFGCPFHIASGQVGQFNIAPLHLVTPPDIFAIVSKALNTNDQTRQEFQKQARAKFLEDNNSFKEAFGALL
jgi:hypothetical protein